MRPAPSSTWIRFAKSPTRKPRAGFLPRPSLAGRGRKLKERWTHNTYPRNELIIRSLPETFGRFLELFQRLSLQIPVKRRKCTQPKAICIASYSNSSATV